MIVHAHRDVGSVGDYDICTAAKEIVGVAASEQATAIAFDEASRRGVYLVALLAWSDWTARGSPAIEWSTLQSVGGNFSLSGWPSGRSVTPMSGCAVSLSRVGRLVTL
jgi:hypothetical protein